MAVRELLWRLIRYAVLLLCASRAVAGTIDPQTPDERYLEFGRQFLGVVQLQNTIDCEKCQTQHQQIASAVLIRPHWALTAAHVVDAAREHVIIIADKKYPLAHVIKHQDYLEDNTGFHDIALLYSPEDFQARGYVRLHRKADEVGRAITIAGFGSYGTFLTGATQLDNQRRAGHNKIDLAERAVLICSPSVTEKFPLEFSIAPGDSGGGMFIGDELAGINSFLAATDKNPNGTYGDQSAFTRVSLYADWVESEIEQHERALAAQATLGPNPVADLDDNASK